MLVKRQRQRPWRIADHLGRVPVRHLSEDGAPADQSGAGRHAFVDGGADGVDGSVDRRVGDDPPAPPRREGTHLEDGDLAVGGGAELDIQVLGAGDALDLDDGADQGRHARRLERLGPRAVDEDGLALAAAGDGVRAAGEVVVVDHVVRTAGIQVAGQHDARQHRILDHGLDEDLVSGGRRAVAIEDGVDSVGEHRRVGFDVDEAEVGAGVGRVPPVLAGGAGTHGEAPGRKAPDDALDDLIAVMPPVVHRHGDLRAQLGSRDFGGEPFQGVRLGVKGKGSARCGRGRNVHGRR